MAARGSTGDRQLAERLKELDCLYGIARLLSRPAHGLQPLLREVVERTRRAWQFPDRACVQITLRGLRLRSVNYGGRAATLRRAILLRGKPAGSLEVGYLKSAGPPPAFLPEEKKLLRGIVELLGGAAEKLEADEALRESARQLAEGKAELEQKNSALREIIAQVEVERREIEERVQASIERLVLPTLARLRSPGLAPEARLRHLQAAEQNLRQIVSPFVRRIAGSRLRLSPREIEICNLIKNGLASKEIAESLGISTLTVERHRHNIRAKLNIAREKVNLATYLHEL